MKKIFFGFLLVITSLLFAMEVNASSFNVYITGDSTFEKEITLYIKFDNFEAEGGLEGLLGQLKYDDTKISLASVSPLADFSLEAGPYFAFYNTKGVANGTNIGVMKFSNIGLSKDESTTITFSDITGTDGDNEFVGNPASKTIKLVVKEEEKPKEEEQPKEEEKLKEEVKEETKKEEPKKEETKVPANNQNNNVEQPKEEVKSNNNYLSSVTLSNGKVELTKEILTYDVIVSYDVAEIEIGAVAEDEKALVEGAGKYQLEVGTNAITLKVKAEDGTERVYTINVHREEENIVVEDEEVDEDVTTGATTINPDEVVDKKTSIIIYSIMTGAILLSIFGFAIFMIKRRRMN